MPLVKGSSKEAVSTNIQRELASGTPKKQAVAVALRKAGVPKKGAKKPEKKGNPY